MKFALFTVALLLTFISIYGQTYNLSGKITNAKLEPIAFARVQIQGQVNQTFSKENGMYSLTTFTKGAFTIVATIAGYKPFTFNIVLQNDSTLQNIILQETSIDDEEILVMAVAKDKSVYYIKRVLEQKKEILNAIKTYQTDVYIKATETTLNTKQNKKIAAKAIKNNKPIDTTNTALQNMNMAEIKLLLEAKLPNKFKETRQGVAKRGNPENLFFLTTTDGDFSLYNNLIQVPAIAPVPFLSPISFSGIVAYKFKTKGSRKENGRTIYTVSFKPTAMGNTLLTGEVDIIDSLWVIQKAIYSLPKYHLSEYDNFTIQQEYNYIQNTTWLLNKQQFTYDAKVGRGIKKSGETKVFYNNYILNPTFKKNYFGNELSSATKEAYQRDSSFWNNVRSEPLTKSEIKLINYKDSIERVVKSKPYLDSIDGVLNKITTKKVLFDGITFYKRTLNRKIEIGSLAQMLEPIVPPGGTRIGYNLSYNKTYKNKKEIDAFTNFSYGLANKDFNGDVRVSKLYNPFNRGTYALTFGRSFDFLFQGDAIFNALLKQNIFRKAHISFNHFVELANGLFLINEVEFAQRSSIENFKFRNPTSNGNRSLFGRFFDSLNVPRSFATHNAFYNNITLSYTPKQRYIREPYQKLILGSSWPTFSIKWRKGLQGIFGSDINYDYVEGSIRQTLKLGTIGVSKYSLLMGNFLNKKSLLIADYKFMRGKDPGIFFNPEFNFQNLDSTFAVFKNFVEGHYVHEFNGAILNKIPLLKKLQLREIAGGGILLAPERNLRYLEFFAGIESKPFLLFKAKLKVGMFAVTSISNQFKSPVSLKFSVRSFDFFRNVWN